MSFEASLFRRVIGLSSLIWVASLQANMFPFFFPSLTGPCEQTGIRRLVRPYYPDRAAGSSPTFDFIYLHYRKAGAGAPTVIYLPGGPGGTSINHAEYIAKIYPEEMGLVFLDPRGVGCNHPGKDPYPRDFYSTKFLALDALAVISDLKLSDYILHGLSYGTAVATEAAALAERGSMSRPSAVVLEGVLGRSFTSMEIFEEFPHQWALARDGLPAAVRARMDADPTPLGISADDWGSGLAATLSMRSTHPSFTTGAVWDPGFGVLRALLPAAPAIAREYLERAVKRLAHLASHPDPDALRLYQAIACRELASEVWNPNLDTAFRLTRGRLIARPAHTCDGIPMDRKFDSADWKTSAPTFYFSGWRDPSTPMQQARYHFTTQTSAPRTFVEIAEGGHCALSSSMRDCFKKVMSAIADDGRELRPALASCRFATRMSQVASE